MNPNVIVVSPRSPAARPASLPKRRTRPCERSATPKAIRATDRDFRILAGIHQFDWLGGEQIRRLFFPRAADRRCRRRLRLLYDQGLINRIRLTVQPTPMVPPYAYVLTMDGARLLASRLGSPVEPYSLSGRQLSSLLHQYLVTEFYVQLTEATRATGLTVPMWRREKSLKIVNKHGKLRAERVSIEDPNRPGPEPATVLPDAYFELRDRAGHTLPFFYELDLSNHSQARWRQRAFAFAAYGDPAHGNRFARRFGHTSFRLLIVTTADPQRRRAQNIRRTINAAVGNSRLFLVTTLDQLAERASPAEILVAPIWQKPGDDVPCSLVRSPGKVSVVSKTSVPSAQPLASVKRTNWTKIDTSPRREAQ
jgi:hypothetical protein